MGFMTLLCSCYCCKQMFVCSPTLVPSLPANLTSTGEKEPVCRNCIERSNPERIKNGLPPIEFHPDAYVGDDCP